MIRPSEHQQISDNILKLLNIKYIFDLTLVPMTFFHSATCIDN